MAGAVAPCIPGDVQRRIGFAHSDMHYESHRGLIDIAVGMARAMGRFYGETLLVTKVSEKALRIVFPTASQSPG